MTETAPTYPPAPLRVLVVDDEADARLALRHLLGIWGHAVCEAADAGEALRAAPAFRPDVALVDLALPDGDGLDLAARLRALPGLSGLEVLALKGRDDADKRRRAAAAGVRPCLVKPTDEVTLRRLLGQLRHPD